MNMPHPGPHVDPASVDMADLPVQLPASPSTAAQARARFFNSGNAFDIKLPPVPAGSFDEVAAQALAATSTGWFVCDQSAAMGFHSAATTPLMLARYARIAAGESLIDEAAATGSVWFVIEGSGRVDPAASIDPVAEAVETTSRGGPGGFSRSDEPLAFGPGDVLLLPGGKPYAIDAGDAGALLWTVSNQPQLAFDACQPPLEANAPIDVVHYPAAEIARQLEVICAASTNEATSGRALIFSSARQEAQRNLTPTLTLSDNTLPPHSAQRPHRHNSAAVTLIVQGTGCHSMVDGVRCDWTPWTTMVTPPGAPHSHHNDGDATAIFLIVQDGGLHYHARTMGFEFLG
ncbi:MAG: cupin protein [Rhizobacter sp.]|nr:cupin protein [Rhizobacter sp.]